MAKISEKVMVAALPFVARGIIRLLRATMRVEYVNYGAYRELAARGAKVIIAFWHGRLLMMPYCYLGGGISILLFGMISSIGIKNMVDARLNLANPKILIITATMLVLGLGGATFVFGNLKLSGLGLAAIFGIVLNLILRPRDPTSETDGI